MNIETSRDGSVTRNVLFPIAALVVGGLVLSGCDSVNQAFGLDRNVPDEFAVVSRAPLSMPPDFSLQPPRPGAPRPQEGTASQRGMEVVMGESAGVIDPGVSAGENAFLAEAGAASADPNIRQIVDQESTELLVADQGFVDNLIFWRDEQPAGTIVDPEAEARRIQANQALGRPITEGDVPVIERKDPAPLEGLFDF